MVDSPSDCQVIALHPRQLESGLTSLVELAQESGVSQFHIVLPDLVFLLALTEFDSSHPAVKTVLEAWSIGITTRLIIHRQLLPMLPVSPLVPLPLDIRDHKGVEVHLRENAWLNYGDVALLSQCWLLTQPCVQLTDLAREHMEREQVYLVTKRRGYVSRKSDRFGSRTPEDPFTER
ncbi:PduM family microcompartment protein [Photobacterium sp. DNB23_23_1]|uniref:PduM family microcompartment protein n=1 Tax=Photobacterium pectinilyticum TaxID=2906793 RepID=A0ABT1N4K1_9GAMM|nr:PduM family microcompartment protein [Photobacterium sp. ZSDE20]MCQ1059656.1 PduM family microcompartment protein [Photobacterium sp. ZSDE20]MDD1825830.1 PduM family microcompartment protein [Photobacterium sp. ZSDE20]